MENVKKWPLYWLFLLGYSIASPSHVHRFDGVTMEYRWSNDGDAWEEKSSSNSELDLNWSYIGLESEMEPFCI